MKLDNIEGLFEGFAKLKVLVIGDVMVDGYIYGSSERISTEAPVPIVNVKKLESRLGGAANVALNIQALGGEPVLCSVIGDDENGNNFINLLHKHNISSKGVIKSESRDTNIKHRVFAGSRQMLRFDSESVQPLNNIERNTFLDQILSLLEGVDVIVFEDYNKGTLDSVTIHKTIEAANKLGIPTIVDAKRRNSLEYRGATLFKTHFNILKAELKFDLEQPVKEDIDHIVNEFRQDHDHAMVMVTLSNKGIYINDGKTSTSEMLEAHERRIADIGGAGDAVISVTSLCLALKAPIATMAEMANIAGGLVCEYPGVVPVQKDKLFEAVKG